MKTKAGRLINGPYYMSNDPNTLLKTSEAIYSSFSNDILTCA